MPIENYISFGNSAFEQHHRIEVELQINAEKIYDGWFMYAPPAYESSLLRRHLADVFIERFKTVPDLTHVVQVRLEYVEGVEDEINWLKELMIPLTPVAQMPDFCSLDDWIRSQES